MRLRYLRNQLIQKIHIHSQIIKIKYDWIIMFNNKIAKVPKVKISK